MAILREVEVGVREALARRSHVQYRLVPDRREAIGAAIREAHRRRHGAHCRQGA